MTLKEQIAVMQAKLNDPDAVVEARSYLACEETWIVTEPPNWNWAHAEYRIAPKPKELWVVRYASGQSTAYFTELRNAESCKAYEINATIEHYRQVL